MKPLRVASFAAFALAAWIVSAPSPAAADWWNGFSGSGLSGCVHALAVHEGVLVAGGSFTVATPEGEARNIAWWDGGAWRSFGGPALNGVVYALTVHDGDLIAGGSLFGVGGGESFGLARRTETGWTGLGRGTDGGAVYALRGYDGDLYAGGAFQRVGAGVLSPHVARWNGTDWLALGSGADGIVRALEVHRGELWIGGEFAHAGTLEAARLARWGSAFGWATAPNAAFSGVVNALTEYEGDLIVAGSFAGVNHAVTSANIARFDYDAWTWSSFHPLGGGPGPILALARFGDDLAAGGSFDRGLGWPQDHVALADRPEVPGRTNPWIDLGSGLDGDVRALLAAGASIYAGGCFTQAGALASPGVARWDGAGPVSVGAAPARAVLAAWPNPATGPVTISLGTRAPAEAELTIHDLHGRRIATLHRGAPGGTREFRWNGARDDGATAPAGIYVVRLRAAGVERSARIVRLP